MWWNFTWGKTHTTEHETETSDGMPVKEDLKLVERDLTSLGHRNWGW